MQCSSGYEMNGYQFKRIAACANSSKLSVPEKKFIIALAVKPIEYELTDSQNHTLNQLAQKVCK